MKTWKLGEIEVAAHKPEVLTSTRGAARVVALTLPAGERLQEHEVHEHAWLVVTEGEIEITQGGDSVTGGAGLLAEFDPGERHEVAATSDARFLLFLAPWPGEGHPGARDD